MNQNPKPEAPPEDSSAATLPSIPVEPKKTAADASVQPSITNAMTRESFLHKEVEIAELRRHAEMIRERCEAVSGGDMSLPEEMLMAQAMSLDMIFNQLAQRGAANIGTSLSTVEMYMRMALKAQAQCASTLRVLGELRNPRSVMFIREQQNNVAHGHQQVNNNAAPDEPSRVRSKSVSRSNRLIEEDSHAEKMDIGTAGYAGGSHPDLAAVGGIDGPEVGGRKEDRRRERVEARPTVSRDTAAGLRSEPVPEVSARTADQAQGDVLRQFSIS